MSGFSNDELMAVAAAKEIRDGEVAIIGTGLPMIAGYLAKYTHAPSVSLLFESGVIDAFPNRLATGVGDFCLVASCVKLAGVHYALSLLQGGAVDLGFLGAAEIDEYGNINSTFIGGEYAKPKVRFGGSGGANDIASLAGRVVAIVPHQKRKFPRRCQYVTTPGHLDGPGARSRAALRGKGPVRVVTDLAVLGFDEATGRMKIESIHPQTSLQRVRDSTGFELIEPKDIGETPSPTPEQLRLLRDVIDPDGVYISHP